MNENPYQAPETTEAPPVFPEGHFAQYALAVRQEHIKHEASVKSIGILYYIGAVALSFAAVSSLLTIAEGGNQGIVLTAMIGIFFAAMAAAQFIGARSIRKLQPAGRVIGIILSAIGLLGFPLGTLINGYILYLLLCKKGQMIFSPAYPEIVAATPDVKYKTSRVVWAILILFLVLIIIGVIAAISAS